MVNSPIIDLAVFLVGQTSHGLMKDPWNQFDLARAHLTVLEWLSAMRKSIDCTISLPSFFFPLNFIRGS